MTDEETQRIVKKVLNVDGDYGDMDMEMLLVREAYRAAMKSTQEKLEELQSQWYDDQVPYRLHEWLDAKLKEKP